MANSSSTTLVKKLWNCCNIIQDNSLSFGDHVEQLTFRLFLKVAGENLKPPLNQWSPIPAGKDWPAMEGLVFHDAQFKIQGPGHLWGQFLIAFQGAWA